MINTHYNDCYFSDSNGYHESKHVFINGNFTDSVCPQELNIGETGFGSGLNLLVLEDFFSYADRQPAKLFFTTVEKYPLKPDEVIALLKNLDGVSEKSMKRHLSLYNELYSDLKSGWNHVERNRDWGKLVLNVFIGDIMDSFVEYPVKNNMWFLDGHSPDKNPEMWSENTFMKVAENSLAGATFATFTAAGIVKRGLRDAGFFVKRIKGYGRKRHMICGYLEK